MFSNQFLISMRDVCFASKTNYGKSISRPFFVEVCYGKILDLQKMVVFLEQLCVQTFVSRRGRTFPIRIDERKSLVKVLSNFVEIELHSCKNNDPTRVCGWLFSRARARPDPYRCRAGIYPPAFFSPGPADPIPPYDGGGGRRGDNSNNNNNTMASPRGPVPSSRPGKFG